ncbi:MAG TPA: IclR family transcriptional regulator C-terminal domain-containing protein [Novosphingobium sp.]|nr:IclR family transcriptional regulator C-terminal domain-containing protein [Novosphingobium sp.]HZV10637.1 IclR family transcriptional regulator C-terminal domain-containing protein [Novosphingobium sp.]
MDDGKDRDYVQSVERCLRVMQAFADGPRFLGLPELAAKTGLSKPTVRRMLLTLKQLGFVTAADAKFALTARMLDLGYAYLSSVDLPAIAQPLMEELTEELKASTALVALDGDDVVYMSRVHRHRISSISLPLGARLPAYVTASGRVLLAGLNDERLEDYLGHARLEPLTFATIADPAALRARLRQVREQGWATVDQELEIERRSAAAPIRDADGHIVAALSLSCSTLEATMAYMVEQVVPRLVSAAQRISEGLGRPSSR